MLNWIREFIQGIRPGDIVDIAVISTFIYLLLVWFKKARARFILLGMVILGSIYLVARFWGLYLTTMLFQGFFAILLIIVVVIFQDDLRYLFERIAILGIRHKYKIKILDKEQIDILSSAIANLSRKQIGALVVIRGRDPLERYLEAGERLDSSLNQILLESIFDPHVPSHDGAVVIEGSRIIKFGCHLPLSINIQEIGRLGTRHAAALGLSERTDAICIIVSEETGMISIAEAGGIRQLGDITELHSSLENFYCDRFPRRKKKTFLLDFLTAHYLEKIAAVVLACGLWIAFGHRTDIIRRDFVVPIAYRNLARDMIIGEPKPKNVSITLSGSERAFSLLDPKELHLSLDMLEVKDGENELLLTRDLIRHHAGLSVVNIEPDAIQLKIYRLITMNVPVEIKTHGSPPSGIAIREIKIEPREVSVIVTSRVPRDKIFISTEPIDLKSIQETTTLTPKLVIAPDIRFPNDKYPEVKVSIEVEEKQPH